jgi:predicted nucleotidyltransferase
MIEANISGILTVLDQANVEMILVGGAAGIVHGLARTTYDVDVVYARDEANLQRIVEALKVHAPYLRGAPPGLPFRWDVETLRRGLNFTLTTSLGNLDLLGEVAGGGNYYELLERSRVESLFDMQVRVIDLRMLVHLKRAAGRPKDFEVIAMLEALVEEKERLERGDAAL